MENIPVYWKTTLEDVEETLKLVKKGKVSVVTNSAGGSPIYQVEYGKSNLKKGTANYCSAMGAHDVRYYADKTGEDYVPTLFLCGCIHGGEFEGTAALLNLIKLLETGTDYDGKAYPEYVELMSKLHLIIIPICNPDGRNRVPFNSFVGRTFYELRYYDQGTWKDGSLCDWPKCKAIHPIKDAVDYLGAYFNDDGVNMMHEDYFGYASKESGAVLDVCRNEAPDFSILLHGGGNTTNCILWPEFESEEAMVSVRAVSNALKARSEQEGVPYWIPGPRKSSIGFTLPSAMHHLCGGAAVTYESNQGLVDGGNVIYSHEEIYKAHRLLFEETAKHLLCEVRFRKGQSA